MKYVILIGEIRVSYKLEHIYKMDVLNFAFLLYIENLFLSST